MNIGHSPTLTLRFLKAHRDMKLRNSWSIVSKWTTYNFKSFVKVTFKKSSWKLLNNLYNYQELLGGYYLQHPGLLLVRILVCLDTNRPSKAFEPPQSPH